MAGSVNKVILIGNLGRDPEIKNFENGGKIATFSVATTENWKDPKTNEKQSVTDWHNVVIRRPALADIAERYLKKGMSVYLEGKLRTRTYQTKEGETRYVTEVVADEFQMLTPKAEGSSAPYQSAPAEAPAGAPVAAPAVDDDLPF